MLWTHKIFLCVITATSQGWLVYACRLRIAGFRGGESRLKGWRLRMHAVWKPLPGPVLRSSATTHTAALG
jgi:hypothetical protein